MDRFLSPKSQARDRNEGRCDGFDSYAGQRWIYPNNFPIRGYQKAAVEMALFNNAMIVLPTGFGKTFIAAVVMYNFYRWYPEGKIIFMAPTKPLVAQQIEECRKISGIPKRDCFEATGVIKTEKRRIFWLRKRVIFATPQVIENDLENGLLPAKSIRCIVLDEAHKAQGNYAYVTIVRHLHENNRDGFRVLALSATPGSDITRVQQVIQNLYVNEVMFRSENSFDLIQYRNTKCSKAWTVELLGAHKNFVDRFINITSPVFKQLHRAGLTYSGDSIDKVAKYVLVKALQGAIDNTIIQGGVTKGHLKYLCCAATALSHNFELLTLYGIRPFYSSVSRSMSESKSSIRTCLAGKVEFDKLLEDIRKIFGDDLEPEPDKKAKVDLLQGHPKLVVVRDLLMDHFKENEGKKETRAIVFTKYRESVYDIVQTLRAFEPFIKPAAFVGQGARLGGGKAGMRQRDQIELIQQFKRGECNVMVATCVAEEGLDIGEVDLIICYDTSSSPISSTQRRGRTGRKRSGNVQTICTKGFEEKKLQRAGASKRQVEDQLFRKENYVTCRYREAPRMVPHNVFPICMEHKVYPIEDDEEDEDLLPKRKRKKRQAQKDPVPETKSKGECSKKCIDEDMIEHGIREEEEEQEEKDFDEVDDENWDEDWVPPPLPTSTPEAD